MPEIKVDLKLGNRTMAATVKLPDEPVRPVELLPILHSLSDAIVGVAISESVPVSCRERCAACCRQLIPLSETEALYLAAVVHAMPMEQKVTTIARFNDVGSRMKAAGLLDRFETESGDDTEAQRKIAVDYFHLRLDCPFLANESCSIYPYRPVKCREYMVTSPPAHCETLSTEAIEPVPVPAKLASALFGFSDLKGQQTTSVVPLPLLLAYAYGRGAEAQQPQSSVELFLNFLRQALGN